MASSFCCWSQRSVLSLGPMGQLLWNPGMLNLPSAFLSWNISSISYLIILNHFLKKHRYVYSNVYIYIYIYIITLVHFSTKAPKPIFPPQKKQKKHPTQPQTNQPFWVPRQSPSIYPSIPCSTQIASLQRSFQSNSGCLVDQFFDDFEQQKMCEKKMGG